MIFSHLIFSHILSLSGFKNSDGRRPSLLGTTIANAVTGTINAPFHIIAIPNTSPTLAMVTNQSPGTPTYILSEDQFETYTVLQVSDFDFIVMDSFHNFFKGLFEITAGILIFL